ncbi:hypothetical protein IQ235_10905 [Oscillatoriales cyanobacterium LEGE 11467]|uniref:Uncharacterized protein n=1 Tax=Zarconia navalis LEGE 11467 TaxID=1828826 RepID=A0A928Z928_9CYAN|nr:hypothetical protein [Zarconia navalis]MBE9041288.1 hypothetical protein [Zarconia navalis LEGE 11467]
MPPLGETVEICGGLSIPEPFRNEIVAEYERLYPNIDILFSVNREQEFFSFYHRTREISHKIADCNAIVLDPVGPAKGSGYILLLAKTTIEYQPAYLLSMDGYNKTKEQWMREWGQTIAKIVSLPFEEYSLGADA